MKYQVMLTVLLLLGALGCDSSDVTPSDTFSVADTMSDSTEDTVVETTDDTATEMDTVSDTATEADTVADTVSAGTSTAWGPITGACGTLSGALLSSGPSFHRTTWAFDSAVFDPGPLDPGPALIYEGPNAGGSSKCTEAMSMQLLIECEDAEFYKTETQITYDMEGSITDYEMRIDGELIGVSVTRAYLGPVITEYTLSNAVKLIDKKLDGVVDSSENVSEDDRWNKQILHIWTLNPDWVDTLETAWDDASVNLRADTVVLVTVEQGSDFVVTDSCDD